MDPIKLTAFEREALELLLSAANCADERLKYQIEFARVQRRDYTGVGSFVELEVPDRLAASNKERLTISNLCGEMEGLRNGFGGVLFIDRGKVQMLEFFTYDEPWPRKPAKYRLSLLREGGAI